MKKSVIEELILKALQIMKIPAICYGVGGPVAIGVATIGRDSSGVVAVILFASCLFGCGVHAAMLSATEERRGKNLPFIMGLPIGSSRYALWTFTKRLAINLTPSDVGLPPRERERRSAWLLRAKPGVHDRKV